MVLAENVRGDIAEVVEMVGAFALNALASLAVQNSHCTLASAFDGVVDEVESVDKNHLVYAVSKEYYASVPFHNPYVDKPFEEPKKVKCIR